MANSWVNVRWDDNVDVYVNGEFVEAAGRTNRPFRVEIGPNTFTLLTPAREVLTETTADVGPAPQSNPVIVALPVPVVSAAMAARAGARRPARKAAKKTPKRAPKRSATTAPKKTAKKAARKTARRATPRRKGTGR